MMRRATNLHGLRSGLAILGLIALTSVGWIARNEVVRQQEATRIEGLVGQLVNADPNQIPAIVKELDLNQKVATTYLTPLVSLNPKTLDEKRSQLHARLAMVPSDPSLREPLVEELLNNKVVYVGPIRRQLRPWAKELTENSGTSCETKKATFSVDSVRLWLLLIMFPNPKPRRGPSRI